MTPEQEKTIERENKKIAQAKARIQAVLAKENAKKRKLQSRQKIILGGLLLENAKKDPKWNETLNSLIEQIYRPQDTKAFEDFKL